MFFSHNLTSFDKAYIQFFPPSMFLMNLVTKIVLLFLQVHIKFYIKCLFP